MEKNVKVFATSTCAKCRQVEQRLNSLGVHFEVVDMASSTSITELRTATTKQHPLGVHVVEAPVVKINGEYYTSDTLFKEMQLTSLLESLVGADRE